MYHRRWKYHETKAPKGVIVNNEKEEAALGDGWVDTPADFGKQPAVPAAPPDPPAPAIAPAPPVKPTGKK